MSAICTLSISLTKSLSLINLWRKNSFFPRKSSHLTTVSEIGLKLTMLPINIIFQGKWPSSLTWQDRQCLLSLFQQSGIFLDQGANCNLQSLSYSIFRGVLSKNFREGKLNWSLASENIHQSGLFPLKDHSVPGWGGSVAWVYTWVFVTTWLY